jgi:hypothetical protein
VYGFGLSVFLYREEWIRLVQDKEHCSDSGEHFKKLKVQYKVEEFVD